MNFSHAQNQLSEANPGMEFSRGQITIKMSEEPLFSEEALDSVFKITIEDHHAKMMNKAEKAFIEIGAFLTEKEDHIQEIGDYLISERAEPGWLSRPNGDEPPRYNISLETLQGVMDEFNRLDEAQRNWHTEEARKAAEIKEEEGLFGNGYMTNEVVYEFDDGWKVVYVPAIGEGPNYKGNNRKSNDRTIEGNLNGLCLGATMGYYQDNRSGKIYSVRDPENNPKVTIRINNNYLAEAKGKNNLPPGVPGAIHAKEWLSTQNISLSGYSSDYNNFPPTTREDAIRDFGGGRDEAYQRGWVMHWYKAGVSHIDKDVEKRIKNNDILIIHSGLGKKYKELVQPVVRFWIDKWTQLDHGDIWGDFNPHQIYQLSHESWKVYKKEPWMKDAVEKLMKERREFGFKIGIHKIKEYDDISIKAARSIIEEEPSAFFRLKLHEEYKDLAEEVAQSLAKKNPEKFFEYGLQETYKHLEEVAAKSLAEKDPLKFFNIKLQDNYPDLGLSAAKSLAEKDPGKFFSTKVRGEPLYLTFPHVIEEGLINYSSYYDDMPYYEEIIPLAAEKLSSRDFANVFLLNINSIPFLDEEIGYILYDLLSSEQRERILKDLPDSTLYLLYRKLEQYDLIDNRLFSNDFIKKIPELTAEFDSESFHDLYGEEDLDSELSEKALKNLMDKNFLKWLDKTKLKQYILLKLRERASEEIGRLSGAYSVEASDPDSYVEEFLDNNYLVLLKEIEKERIKELYYDESGTSHDNKHVLVSDYIEELFAGALGGLCAGIFIWFLKSKNIYQRNIEDEILNDVANEYNFNKYYRLGYNYMVEMTGIDELSAGSGERYMHETEGIYEKDDNLYESGYNPFGELFYRQKTREEVEEELGEELEDDPDLINEYEFENDEYEEGEFEDEVFGKFSKLYKYLVSSGFLKEAELLGQLTKVAVLKRLKRTTRGKGKKDRMEWALVSKSNPKKILKWFGPDKPSKKEVAKEERRVHAFG